MTTRTAHDPTICERDVAATQYVGNGYKSRFQCSVCARSTWQQLSFLGRRAVVCDGQRFTKHAIGNHWEPLTAQRAQKGQP